MDRLKMGLYLFIMENLTIYEQAIVAYGVSSQVYKAIEELTELSLSLQHFKIGKVNEAQVITEIADVQIMLDQLKIIHGVEAVNKEIAYKLARLDTNLKNIIK